MTSEHAQTHNPNCTSSKGLDSSALPKGLEFVSTNDLKANARNARTHSKKQINQIAESIRTFGFNNPILIDNAFGVIAGHGRLQAAKLLGLSEVPTVCLSHLSDAEKRAYILADNKIALNAGWDGALLALELGELADLLPEIDMALEITGFDMGEIDVLLSDHEDVAPSQSDEDTLPELEDVVVARPGDIWHLGDHRVLCGDVRDTEAIADLFAGQSASLVLTDPPYNVRVQGHVGGSRQNQTQRVCLCLWRNVRPGVQDLPARQRNGHAVPFRCWRLVLRLHGLAPHRDLAVSWSRAGPYAQEYLRLEQGPPRGRGRSIALPTNWSRCLPNLGQLQPTTCSSAGLAATGAMSGPTRASTRSRPAKGVIWHFIQR